MPQWVRGRNVVQFPFRAPQLEVEIPVVVSGQLRLSIDYLALKGHMDHKELFFLGVFAFSIPQSQSLLPVFIIAYV